MDDGRHNSDEWKEAQRLREIEGDPSSLESLLVALVPPEFQEYVRYFVHKGLKAPSDGDKNLANAVVWYVEHGGESGRKARPDNDLLLQTSKQYGLKTERGCSVLWNAVKTKRPAINDELRRLGYK